METPEFVPVGAATRKKYKLPRYLRGVDLDRGWLLMWDPETRREYMSKGILEEETGFTVVPGVHPGCGREKYLARIVGLTAVAAGYTKPPKNWKMTDPLRFRDPPAEAVARGFGSMALLRDGPVELED